MIVYGGSKPPPYVIKCVFTKMIVFGWFVNRLYRNLSG